jgi:hypothetical protein
MVDAMMKLVYTGHVWHMRKMPRDMQTKMRVEKERERDMQTKMRVARERDMQTKMRVARERETCGQR